MSSARATHRLRFIGSCSFFPWRLVLRSSNGLPIAPRAKRTITHLAPIRPIPLADRWVGTSQKNQIRTDGRAYAIPEPLDERCSNGGHCRFLEGLGERARRVGRVADDRQNDDEDARTRCAG